MGLSAPAPAPKWLIDFCGQAPANEANRQPIPEDVDPEQAEARAVHYLKHDAPEASEGQRDDTAYRIACRLRDFGVDEVHTLALIQEHWDRCYPMLENLEHPVASAFKYARLPPGNTAPEREFEPIEPDDFFDPKPAQTKLPLLIEPVVPFEPADIPKRDWLVGRLLISQKVSVEIAMPGAGKSTHALQTAVAIAARRDDICGEPVHKRGVVTVLNNEDDADEMRRRLAAVMQFFNVGWADIEGRLFIYSGIERPFVIAARRNDGEIYPVDKDTIVEHVRETKTSVLMVDPFLETHRVNENANEEINQVARMYREVAAVTGCAVLLIHHTRKLPSGSSDGHVGNMESGRGASSLGGVARIMVTLYSMSEKDATKYGIHDDMRHRYVRMDDAKANLSLVKPKPRWFERVGVKLSNGDEVGVLSPIELREAEEVNDEMMLEVVQEVVAENDGAATLNQVATALADADLSSKGESRDTISRRLRNKYMGEERAAIVNGWKVWVHCEDGPGGKGKTKYWVYGHVTETNI